MQRTRSRTAAIVLMTGALVGMVACGKSSKSSSTTTAASSGTTAASGGTTAPASGSVSSTSFTSDFSAMAQLKAVASKGKGLIAVLLPDTTSSARYESFDRPYLQKAFEAAGLTSSDYKIDNAQGSASTMQTQAEAAITNGATVLLVDALDSGSGAAIESAATAKGVAVIDYDRLVKGGSSGRTYISFDNVNVGKLIGQGEVDCIAAWKVAKPNILVMDGDPTDNNAKLFAQGYNGVLKPKFDSGAYTKVGEPAGTWTPAVAATTFEQQFTAHPNINAVVTPNDDNANAVIAALQKQKVAPKTFPTTGQDASLPGLQNILKGYQCGTVYKPIYLEAQAAAAVALYLRAGEKPPAALTNGTTKDTTANTDVPSVLLTPKWVTATNMADTVIKDGAAKASDVCVSAVASACTAANIK
ncbi:MAG: D-xylose-binding periplasmic protein [Acidimicrobiales bacterium]|nr:D-xylose-binding periplasmic protein [Acidimicrobiales bacterium]